MITKNAKPLFWSAGILGLLAAVPATHTSFAQGFNVVAPATTVVLTPGDALRFEEEARRYGRLAEERYWRDYRLGLEVHDRDRRDYGHDRDWDRRETGDYPNQRDAGFHESNGFERSGSRR